MLLFRQSDLQFLSTLSLRRATYVRSDRPNFSRISIHALLAESDEPPRVIREPATNFYPRSPCGERHYIAIRQAFSYTISIHALLAESDQLYDTYAKVLRVFLSTLSLRRATAGVPAYRQTVPDFYPRSPCGERRGTAL